MKRKISFGKIVGFGFLGVLVLGILIETLLFVFGGLENKSINYLIGHAPNVRGVVEMAEDEQYLIVNVYEDDPVHEMYPVIWVTLNVTNGDSRTHFEVGEDVAIYYDGNISGNNPGRLETVYAILG